MRGFPYIRRAVGTTRVALFVFVEASHSILSVGIALLLSALLDAISAAIATKGVEPIGRVALIACAYMVVWGLLIIVCGHLKAALVRDVMVSMRQRVMEGLLVAGATGDICGGSADHLTLLGQNMDTLESDWLKGMCDMLASCLQIAVACATLVYINPLVAVISLVGMAIPTLVPRLFAKRLGAQQRKIIASATAYNGRVRDAAQGGEVVRSFHVEDAMGALHRAAARLLEGDKASLARTMVLVSGAATTAGAIVQFAIMGLTGVFAVHGLVTIGGVVAVTQLSGQAIAPVAELSGKLGQLKATYPILDKVDALAARLDTPAGPSSCVMRHTIELRDVDFSYGRDVGGAAAGDRAGKPIASDLSVRFERGRKYAIVGESGSGKSTILKLVAGQLRPARGELLVDGHAGRVPDAAFIHQGVFLFDDSLRSNITLYQEFPRKEVERAIERAGLAGVVAALPDGLGTRVREGGSRLSGGERQRVAIARALLHSKGLLLVDEATSALDKATAAKVEDVLLSLGDVTMIEVTHHLDEGRARRYDAVLTMRDGRLLPTEVR